MNTTRTLITPHDPKLERQWANRFSDTMARGKWNAEIIVDPINRDPKVMKLYGETTYPNGAVERFVQQ